VVTRRHGTDAYLPVKNRQAAPSADLTAAIRASSLTGSETSFLVKTTFSATHTSTAAFTDEAGYEAHTAIAAGF